MSLLESQFQKQVKKKLDDLVRAGSPLYYFVKEAGAIRGIPDIIGCASGQFFAWELKRDRAEADKTHGRIALQRYTLQRIHNAQGLGHIVHQENLVECLGELEKILRTPSASLARSVKQREIEAQILQKLRDLSVVLDGGTDDLVAVCERLVDSVRNGTDLIQ